MATSGLAVLVVWLTLFVLATNSRAVTPTPVTNADGRIVQPVFPPQTQRVVAKAPAAPDFTEQNMRQRWWLAGLMAGLLGIAACYKNSRKRQI